MQDDNPDPNDTSATHGVDPQADRQVALLLASAARRRKKSVGAEPADLMNIARWVDGELAADRRTEVAARIAADPELRATVEALAVHDDKSVRGSEVGARLAPASNVVSLADHARRAAQEKRGKAENATGRAASRVLIGGGSILLLAAILFLAIRPTSDKPTTMAGASVGAGGTVGLRATFASPASGPCEVTGVLSAEAPKTLWYVTLEGAASLGDVQPGPFRLAPRCATSACEVLVATSVGASAPVLDPMSCAPSDPALTAVRLTR